MKLRERWVQISVVRQTLELLLNSFFRFNFMRRNFVVICDMIVFLDGITTSRIDVSSNNSLNSGDRIKRNGRLFLISKFRIEDKNCQLEYTTK